MLERDKLLYVADLMMGAAYVDQSLRGNEVKAIKAKLSEMCDSESLPEDLEDRLRTFEPSGFDVKKAVAGLDGLEETDVRQVLECIAAVNASDEELDFDEDCYLRDVADAFGVSEEAYKDLVLEIEAHTDVCKHPIPPPIPEDA